MSSTKPDGLSRYLQRIRKCPHTDLDLIRQYSHFSYFSCRKCKSQIRIQTYPHPKPEPKDVDPYDSENDRD